MVNRGMQNSRRAIKSDNRGHLLCDDILDLLMFIDERKLIDNLSMYAAVNLE